MRAYNFSAGPAALPNSVIERIAHELPNWKGIGSSVIEVSHRGAEFTSLLDGLLEKWRTLFSLPQDYVILAMPGGATAQFSAVPLNLATGYTSASYLVTGHWSAKAADLARAYTSVQRAYQAGVKPVSIADPSEWNIEKTAAYFHYCHNETVDGLACAEIPSSDIVGDIPIVADVSSCIGAYPIDFSKLSLAYACAQKNLGVSGVTLVIIQRSLLERKAHGLCPSILNYTKQMQANSLLNTPVTFALYACDLMCDWMLAQGGVTKLGERNRQKADLLYSFIDASNGFYSAPVLVEHRSMTNVLFHLQSETLEREFVSESTEAGFLYLKGHRARGGMRANIYNSMSLSGVEELVKFMRDFSQRKG